MRLVARLPASNPDHTFELLIDESPIPKTPEDYTPWSRVFRARNAVLDRVDFDKYDYLLWLDADVVDYPADLPTTLITGNPDGMSAPLVLIENTDRLYDFAAFIQKDKEHIMPDNRNRIWGRNCQHEPPYWNDCPYNKINGEAPASVRWIKPKDRIVEMSCVGTITNVPTWVYKQGVRYSDHPAFTDHYPIALAVRQAGKRVTCDQECVAYHANLGIGKYPGESWH